MTGLVTLSARVNRGNSAYMSLRGMIIRLTGLNPNETDAMQVFFRQNLRGVSFREVYEELYMLANERDKVLQHINILVSPSLGIKETQWYSIIRYCLYCWEQNRASAVFAPPSSSLLTLQMLHNVSLLLDRFDNEMKWSINQMMALRIALWLTKPTYLQIKPKRQSLDTLAQYLQYVRGVLVEALDVHKACSEDHLKEILYAHYTMELQTKMSRIRKIAVHLEHSPFSRADVSDIILNHTNITMWMKFNLILKNDPIADRIRRGIGSSVAGLVTS